MIEKDIVEFYKDNSGKKTCLKFKIGYEKLVNILRKNKIRIRTKSESLSITKNKNPDDFKHSEETKNKLSEIRKKYLKENKDKHVWKRKDKFISEPCEYLKSKLKENKVKFIEEFQPLDDRFYSIDITLLNKKIGIEVNGNQHYNSNKTLKKYYQDRHDKITKKGWILYEVHYTKCYDENFIMDLISVINGKLKDDKLNLNFELKERSENKCYCGEKIHKTSKKCKKCSSIENSEKRRLVKRPSYVNLMREIKDSNYSIVARKYGVSDTAIRKWVKFYEKQN